MMIGLHLCNFPKGSLQYRFKAISECSRVHRTVGDLCIFSRPELHRPLGMPEAHRERK